MAILIDIDEELQPDFDVMCSECHTVFAIFWPRSAGGLAYCPFCGDEIEEETDG